jgi:hypothetical protein
MPPELTANHPAPTDTGTEAIIDTPGGPQESGGAADKLHTEPNPGLEKAQTRDAMLEAAAEARAEFEAAEKAKAEGKPAPAKAKAAAPAGEPSKAAPAATPVDEAVERALAAREAKNEEALAARREADRIRADAQSERDRILAEARQEAALELQKFKERARRDPVGLIKESGWEPAALVKNLAEDGTPQSMQERTLLAVQQELAELRREREAEKQQNAEAQRQAAAKAAEAHHETIGKQFVEFAGNDARPTLQALFKKPTLARAMVLEASAEAERIQRAEGKPPPWDRLADWLESQYSPEVAPKASPPKAAPPTPGKSNARALSQQAASSNSVAPKSWESMTPREQKAQQLADLADVRARFAAGESVGDD